MRRTKEELYKKERLEILKDLIKKIGITKEENKKLKEELENETIKEYIRSKEEEITKYYSTSRWKSIYKEENKELNIIKNIMRENNIEILKIEKKRLKEGKYSSYRVYVFEIPNEI